MISESRLNGTAELLMWKPVTRSLISILVCVSILHAASDDKNVDDSLGLPSSVAGNATVVKVPFRSEDSRKIIPASAIDRLWGVEGGVNFMVGGKGEGYDAGLANTARSCGRGPGGPKAAAHTIGSYWTSTASPPRCTTRRARAVRAVWNGSS